MKTITATSAGMSGLKELRLVKLYKHYIIDSLLIVKNEGLKALLRKRGKKFLLAVFTYYLVRDSIVYIIIPFCIAKGIF